MDYGEAVRRLMQFAEDKRQDPGVITKMLLALQQAAALPGDVYQGKRQATPEAGMDFALNLAGASSPVPRPTNSLGIFGGKIGAKRIGAELTSVGKDAKPRFEIDDSASKLMAERAGWLAPKWTETSPGIFGDVHPVPTVGEVFHHPELFAAYPDLKDTVLVRSNTGGGSYSHRNNVISLPDISPANDRSVLLHELQHAVQAREGFSPGANPGMFKDAPSIARANEAARLIQDRLNALYAKVGPRDAKDTPFGDEIKALLEAKRKLGSVQTNLRMSGSPHAQYRRTAGETEARNVQTRADFTPEQRKHKPPEKTEDVPRRSQTLGDMLAEALSGL
jgi:hypothetical protein